MKKVTLTILVISISSICFGQDSTYKNFSVQSSSVVYSAIHEADSTSKEDLTKLLNGHILTLPGVTNVSENFGVLTGQIYTTINYKQYGAGYWTTWIALNHPMTCSFSIQVKDNKYRVVIKNVTWKMQSKPFVTYFLEDAINKKKGVFKSKTIYLDGLDIVQLYFLDIFTLNAKDTDSDW